MIDLEKFLIESRKYFLKRTSDRPIDMKFIFNKYRKKKKTMTSIDRHTGKQKNMYIYIYICIHQMQYHLSFFIYH